MEELNTLLFDTKPRERMEAERIARNHLEYHLDGRCALIYLTRDEIEQSGVDPADLEELTSLPISIEGVKVGLTLRQQPGGSYRISVRTAKGVDACAIARRLGGGGHTRAAGCELLGNLDNAKSAILAEVEAVLDAADAGGRMMQGILIVDKPTDWTSFDVIAKLRGILGTRKLGHSGTLDPMATGVLPVFCGGASKAVDLQLDHTKAYRAVLKLGAAHRYRRHAPAPCWKRPRSRQGRRSCWTVLPAVRRPPDADAAHVLGGQDQRPAALQNGAAGHRGGAEGPPHRDSAHRVRRQPGGERIRA